MKKIYTILTIIVFLLNFNNSFSQTGPASGDGYYLDCIYPTDFYDTGWSFDNYQPNETKEYHFYTCNSVSQIKLTFNNFDIGDDLMTIYDSNEAGQNLIGTYTAFDLFSQVITSSGNALTIVFESNSTTSPGWEAIAECIDIDVQELFVDCNLTTTFKYPASGNYTDNVNMARLFRNYDYNKGTKMVFSSFSLEQGDTLFVYSGAFGDCYSGSVAIDTLVKGDVPDIYGGKQLSIYFKSDGSINSTGFELTTECIDMQYVCYAEEEKYSEEYPVVNYETNKEMIKTYYTDNVNAVINLEFDIFDIGNGTLDVYGGISTDGELLASYSASNSPNVLFTDYREITLKLNTGTTNALGYKANISCREKQVFVYSEYNRVYELNAYTNSIELVSTYTAAYQSQRLMAEFYSNFFIDDDILEIYDGDDLNAPLIGTFTNNNTPGKIYSTGRHLTFRFKSNDSNIGVGWTSTITATSNEPVEVSCSGNDELYYPISNEQNSDFIHDNEIITYKTASNLYQLGIFFNSIDIGDDELKIYDGESTSSTLLTTLTGSQTNKNVTASGSYLTFEYIENNTPTGTENWDALFTCTKLPEEQVTCGEIYTFNYPENYDGVTNYENYEDYTFVIKSSDPTKVLELSFNAFDIEQGYDFMYVYDGENTNANQITTLSQSTIPPTVKTTGEYLTVNFTSDYTVTATGWSAYIQCKDKGIANVDYSVTCGSPQSIVETVTQDVSEIEKVIEISNPAKKIYLQNMSSSTNMIFEIYAYENETPNLIETIYSTDIVRDIFIEGKYAKVIIKPDGGGSMSGLDYSFDISCIGFIPQDEYDALVALYNNTDGDNWKNSWDLNASPANWYGVSIENNNVVGINLSDNNLSGTIPVDFSNLNSLLEIDLSENNLQGEWENFADFAPAVIKINLYANSFDAIDFNNSFYNLEYLNLSSNTIEQAFSENIYSCHSLKYLNISDNQFKGKLDENLISQLSELEYLNLSNNLFYGSLPKTIGTLTKLTELYLNENFFSGSIPSSIGNLTKLIEMHLYSNTFTGELPPSIGQIVNLQSLKLDKNILNGTIPSEVYNLHNLKELTVSKNEFTGELLSNIENLKKIEIIDISDNNFYGELPANIGNLARLEQLNISGNSFSGNIPQQLYNLDLEIMNISKNNFTGGIDSAIGLFVNMTSLNVSGNNLSGTLPSTIGNLQRLTTLDLSTNNFSGEVPQNLNYLFGLTELNLSENNFSYIPVFDNIAYAGYLKNLTVNDNDLRFESIIPNTMLPVNFQYSPQSKLNEAQNLIIEEATELILTVELCADGASYTWQKNGQVINILTTNTFEIDEYYHSDAGTYKCLVTHPDAPELTLERYPIVVETYQAPLLNTDREALELIYAATSGDTWTNSWSIDGNPLTQDGGDPSTWYGVTISKSGRVTALNLDNNNLIGTLPTELGNLTGLVDLNLSRNYLWDELPATIGNLVNLKKLNLSANSIFGQIPSGINNLTQLASLDLSSNDFRYTPPAIGNLINLVYLSLSNNKLEAIPAGINNLTKLSELYLNNNYITGNIPSDINLLQKLKYLYLNNNQLSGKIPEQLFDLTGLKHIDLNNNSLSGEINWKIINLENLNYLNLSFNNLSGDFPVQIASLYAANIIKLRNNNLTGIIPSNIGNLWQLEEFDVRNNSISGTIPSMITNCYNLKELYLSGNSFEGAIPADIEKLNALEVVDLKNNQFDNITAFGDLSAFKYISELSLENNKLEFDDLQSIPTTKMSYSPQANVQNTQTYTIQEGQQFTLSAEVGGTGNLYQWYKGGQKIGLLSTSNTYKLTSVDNADAGVYYCEVINPSIPGLTITRNPVTLSFVVGGPVDVYPADIAALEALHATTDGNNWKNKDNWLNYSVSIGTWHGVTLSSSPVITENSIDYYRVTSVNLQNNSLNGTLPPEIGNLKDLATLNLSINRLSGNLPEQLTTLAKLEKLDLSSNSFSGNMPTGLYLLTALEELNISNNHFSGNFPQDLMKMSALKLLSLAYNDFSGELDFSQVNLPDISELNIADNEFEGTLPSEINSLLTLQRLVASGNEFSGDFPVLDNLSQLAYVDVNGNNFSSFPSLSALTLLEYLDIKNNRLEFDDIEHNLNIISFIYSPQDFVYETENVIVYETLNHEIESEVGGSENFYKWYKDGVELNDKTQPTLTISNSSQNDNGVYTCLIANNKVLGLLLERNPVTVTVSKDSLSLVALYNATNGSNWTKNDNWLTGNLDSWYGVTKQNGRVMQLELPTNNLSGYIPPEIGNLEYLSVLNLKKNVLTPYTVLGVETPFPSSIGNLSNLEILDLSNNEIKGDIPEELYNLTNLTSLNLSYNNIGLSTSTGVISENIAKLTNAIVINFSHCNIGTLEDIEPLSGNELFPNLQLFDVGNNYIGLSDLIANVPDIPALRYANQSYYATTTTTGVNEFSDFTISAYENGTDTEYQWYRDDTNVSEWQSSPSLSITYTRMTDAGTYKRFAQNSIVPDLVLQDYDYVINVYTFQLPIKETDKQALIDLYNSTNGENWTGRIDGGTTYPVWDISATNAFDKPTLSSNGIEINREGYITSIDLSNRNLNGTLPVSIGNLQELSLLKLNDNLIQGAVPDAIANLPVVETIDISSNSITALPELVNISGLRSLNTLSNYIDFTSIEQNIDVQGYLYSPQKRFTENVSTQGGSSLTITFDAGGTATYYQWFDETGKQVAEGNTFIIEDADNSNAQKYTCVAKNYLAQQSDFSLEKEFNVTITQKPIDANDLAALIAIREAVGDANLKNDWDDNIDASTWRGITVDIKGRVTAIDLNSNNLSGELPPAIGDLTMLRNINLTDNQITGSIPAEMANLSNLRSVLISNNQIENMPVLSGLPEINQIDVSDNKLGFTPLYSNSLIKNFSYVPQTGKVYSFNIQGGDNLVLTVDDNHVFNSFEWAHDGQLMDVSTNTHTIINAKKSDNGVFECTVSNNFVPNLNIDYIFHVTVNQSDIVQNDYNALIDLYNATDGANWIYTWDLNDNVLNWHGIELDYSGKVISIDLSNNKLNGSIPASIGTLDKLSSFKLSNNNIMGTIPAEIGLLSELDTLLLNKNNIYGTVPDELNMLSNLDVLYLNNNELSVLPKSISNLTILTKLYLNNNKFSGSISSDYFDNLIGLQIVSLANNKFEGELPQFSMLFLLEELNLQNNNFGQNTTERSIPSSYYELWNLRTLNLYNNMLFGELPSTITDLQNLKELRINNNSFYGLLPGNIDELRELEVLRISDNSFSGELPPNTGLMSNLQILDVADNQFSGEVMNFDFLTSIEELVLNNNQFSAIQPFYTDYLSKFEIQNNQLEFDDIEALSAFFNIEFNYSPQAKINNSYTETVDNYSSFEIVTTVNGSNLNYQWYQNGEEVGENSPVFSINLAQSEHSGEYVCVVTSSNSDIDLQLQRKPVTVNVNIIPIPINDDDYNALLKLYDATNGMGWDNQTGWDMPDKDNKNWYGVTFEGGKVVAIDLSANNLGGYLPDEIGNFKFLRSLTLSNNQIENQLPTALGNLPALEILDLSWNLLKGEIPVEIGNLSTLQSLNLANNQLSGNITPTIGNLTTLTDLNFNSNEFTGTIPDEIGQLVNLKNLRMVDNDLTGSISTGLAELASIEVIELADNYLTGSFPIIGNLSNLKTIDIAYNSIENIPDLSLLWVENLIVNNNKLDFEDIEPNIYIPFIVYAPQSDVGTEQSIVINYGMSYDLSVDIGGDLNDYQWKLDANDIDMAYFDSYTIDNARTTDSGTYTCVITNTMTPLLVIHRKPVHVTVSRDSIALAALYRHTNGNNWTNNDNWLTGNLDTWHGVTMLDGRVQSVKLDGNNLDGIIPDSIRFLEYIEEINLLNNHLTGSIPNSIGELQNLSILNLRNNKLSGELPEGITQLSALTSLNLSYNLIGGTIKAELSNLQNAIVLDLSNNYFRDLEVLDVNKLSKLQLLSVLNNKLTYEDIIPNQNGLAGFSFNPQRKFNLELDINKNKGDSYTLRIDSVGGNNLTYQWTIDNRLFGQPQSVNTFEINDLNVSQQGKYTCRVYSLELGESFFIEREIISLTVVRELSPPDVIINNSYCFGDNTVTLSVEELKQDEGIDIVWYADKALTDSITQGYNIQYVLYQEVDTVYAIRFDGSKKGTPTEVIIHLRPQINRSGNNLIATFVEGATYTWYFNGEKLTENTHTLTINSNFGEYRVSILLGGCTTSSGAYKVTVDELIPLAISNNTLKPVVEIYPNPANDFVNIDFNDFVKSEINIQIFDITGKSVYLNNRNLSVEKSVQIKIADYAKGIYIIKINSEEFIFTKRLIIN